MEYEHRARTLVVLCQIAERHGLEAKIKWPNEVVVGDRKIAEITLDEGAGHARAGVPRAADDSALPHLRYLDGAVFEADDAAEALGALPRGGYVPDDYERRLAFLGENVDIYVPFERGSRSRAAQITKRRALMTLYRYSPHYALRRRALEALENAYATDRSLWYTYAASGRLCGVDYRYRLCVEYPDRRRARIVSGYIEKAKG